MRVQPVIDRISSMIQDLSMHDCEEIRLLISEHIKENFVRPKKCKRGSLPPYITQEKWKILLENEPNHKFRFAYILMRKLALRIGEVVNLRLNNIHLDNREIFLITEKSKTPDVCYIDDQLYIMLVDYIRSNKEEILKHKGYIFFPSSWSNSSKSHITKDSLRNAFRKAVSRSGFQFKYGHAYAQNRSLNLYTSHSCRHSGITDFYVRTKDIVLTQKYARHSSIKSTMVYIHRTKEDLKKMILEPELKTNDEISDLRMRISTMEERIKKRV